MRWLAAGQSEARNSALQRWARAAWSDLRALGPVLALTFVSGALLAGALYYLRGDALRSGETLTQSLAHVIAEQSSRTLQTVDQRLQLTAARLQTMEADGALREESARNLLRAQLADMPFVRAIWVLDAQGRIEFDSDLGNIGTVLADRDYFTVYQRAPSTEFFIGPLVKSRTTGDWLMSASLPWRGAGGVIRGVVVAAVHPPYFQELWKSVELGPDGAVALMSAAGQVLMRSPPDPAVIGRTFTQLHWQQSRSDSNGVLRVQSRVDGVDRLLAYRFLPNNVNLVVTVGTSYKAVLASWKRTAWLAMSLWALAVLVANAMALQLHWQTRRRSSTERRFRQLAQAMPQIVFTVNRKGEVDFINDRWTEATGLTPDTALGSRWTEALHPDDRERAVQSMTEMMRSGEIIQHEHRLRYRDGVYRWQLLRAVPYRNSEGRVVSWFGTSTEIDSLKQAQARLESQTGSLQMASSLARLGWWSIDPATMRVRWSEEAAALVDMDASQSPPVEEVIALFAPDSADRVRRALQASIDAGSSFDLEIRLVTPLGRGVWIRSIGRPIRDADGRVVRIEGAQQDITDRVALLAEVQALNVSLEQKVAQRTAELARQEALFRTLAEQAPTPIWTVDPRGRITFLSRAWYDLVGGAPPQYHGYEWLPLMHPDDLPQVQRNWVESARTGHAHEGTRRIRARDGSYHTTTFRAVPVRDEAGTILFWVGVDTDITKLVANESALRLANEQLESFSYSVSHDLRSPLERVGSFAQLLENELGEGASTKARHYLSRIRANAEFMSQLIDGLLALARVSQMEMVRGAVNLSELATAVLQRLQSEQPHRRVTWRVAPNLVVLGDVRLMRSVMENLVGNAWKFTAREPAAQIEVGGSPERGEFFVRDNGAGFDMAYADKLFGTFQRLHRDDEFPGTGIGLATVARAITRQGGRIWARAKLGEGATFFFTMPVPSPAEVASRVSSPERPPVD